MANTRKDSEHSREDELFARYQNAYSRDNFPEALTALQEMLSITDIKAFVSSLIVDVYMQMGEVDEAYGVAAAGIKYPNPPSKLHKQYAELIVAKNPTMEDLNEALSSIDKAIALYNNDSISEDIADRFKDADTFKFWFEDKTRTRTDMASLRSDIRSLIYSTKLYNDIQYIENRLSREKQRTIELMGLFTAIIALIFSNVQALSQKRGIWEIAVVNISLVVALTWILWLIRRIESKEKFIHRPSFTQVVKILGSLIAILALIVIAGLIMVGILQVYAWIKSVASGVL
ncbi:MAG: hypothetical protein Q4A37_01325 [Candidatus Saccharibacteria bacterium]|nr:hypothetical protein [Candidatus Saccharibacteria bacterium]